MTTTVSLDHNIDDVVSDIDSLKRDLHKVNRAVRRVMDTVAEDARAYVRADADYMGPLRRSIGVSTDTHGRGKHEVSVSTDASVAPYATLVEFGSGTNTNVTTGGSVSAPMPESPPAGMPFDTPDQSHVPFLADNLAEWMRKKPVQPEYPTVEQSAWAIAMAIVDKGQYAHPFLRPAWFQNELRIKQAARNAVRKAVR